SNACGVLKLMPNSRGTVLQRGRLAFVARRRSLQPINALDKVSCFAAKAEIGEVVQWENDAFAMRRWGFDSPPLHCPAARDFRQRNHGRLHFWRWHRLLLGTSALWTHRLSSWIDVRCSRSGVSNSGSGG